MIWRYNLPKCPVSPEDRGEEVAVSEHEAIMVRSVALAICKSQTCEGISCCQWPANGGRTDCNAKRGAYDPAARAAMAALSLSRPERKS